MEIETPIRAVAVHASRVGAGGKGNVRVIHSIFCLNPVALMLLLLPLRRDHGRKSFHGKHTLYEDGACPQPPNP